MSEDKNTLLELYASSIDYSNAFDGLSDIYKKTLGKLSDAFNEEIMYRVGDDAYALARSHGIHGIMDENAFVHTYVSATIAYKANEKLSDMLGDFKEDSHRLIGHNYNPQDEFKDRWNNKVGLDIARYAKKNEFSKEQMELLIVDAFEQGSLISSLHDERVPPMSASGEKRLAVDVLEAIKAAGDAWKEPSATLQETLKSDMASAQGTVIDVDESEVSEAKFAPLDTPKPPNTSVLKI